MFLAKKNVEILWEVIKENRIKNLDQQTFVNHVHIFWEREKSNKANLYQLNTSFMTFIVQVFKEKEEYDKKIAEQIQNEQIGQNGPIRLNIQENTKPSITYEELHNDRMGEFDKQLEQKQAEFKNMMSSKIPETPDFKDKMDSPIGSEMEKLVAQTMQQRNFDAEQWTQQSPKQSPKQTINSLQVQMQSIGHNRDQNLGQKSVHFSDKVGLDKVGLDNVLDNGLDNGSEFDTTFPKSGLSKIGGSTDIFSKLKHIKPIEPIDAVKELKEQLNELNIKMDKIFKHMNIE
jgi:hypothetical protein